MRQVQAKECDAKATTKTKTREAMGMTERPIIFSAPMVKAILEGRKTQTRRIVKPQPTLSTDCYRWCWNGKEAGTDTPIRWLIDPCPYGASGDRLWVRESFYIDTIPFGPLPKARPSDAENDDIYYRADGECCEQIPECSCAEVGKPKWKPSIHMPRWASRITLEITEVRVQRVHDISREDCRAEGLDEEQLDGGSHCIDGMKSWHVWWMDLWNRINGPGSWEKNPWVWVLTFSTVSPAT